jgi:transcriptional regulator of acetoin/glycerol metabolism
VNNSPRKVCDWCGQHTRNWNRLPDGDYECADKDRCGMAQPLRRMGIAAVLQRVVAHDWNVKQAAASLKVTQNPLWNFLHKYAASEMEAARREGLVGHARLPRALRDPEALRRALQEHGGNRGQCAKALGVGRRTLVRAMERLLPGEFPSWVDKLAERRMAEARMRAA